MARSVNRLFLGLRVDGWCRYLPVCLLLQTHSFGLSGSNSPKDVGGMPWIPYRLCNSLCVAHGYHICQRLTIRQNLYACGNFWHHGTALHPDLEEKSEFKHLSWWYDFLSSSSWHLQSQWNIWICFHLPKNTFAQPERIFYNAEPTEYVNEKSREEAFLYCVWAVIGMHRSLLLSRWYTWNPH